MSAALLRSRAAVSGTRIASSARPALPKSNLAQRRSASSSSSAGDGAGLRLALYGSATAAVLYGSYLYATDTRAFFHRWVVPPLLRWAYPDAEDAHHAGTTALKVLHELNLNPRERDTTLNSPDLAVNVFGTEVQNPIAISAGLDKDGEVADALFDLGAGIVEIGGCTPLPQAGNPKPRVFRVRSLDGMVNRYGLNSRGADDMAIRLRDRLRRFARSLGLTERDVLDGNAKIAKNKETDERDEKAIAEDYVYCVRRLARFADVLVVNVSSPNTPGLRDLQATEPLTRLLSAVVDEAAKTDRKQKPKVMVKVSPDEDEDTQMEGIVEAVHRSGVDGVIVGNTTKRRDGNLMETGGYSGPAMYSRTLDLVGRYRKMLDKHSFKASLGAKGGAQKVIFATGGITNGEQARQILNAGASVAMVYTGLTYGGPGTITRIKQELKGGVKN
ncbi:hypothetical protein NXS19_013514 [Fusarium pseudograminearum]|nr:hypothetical protein NXS19_013514 [Fusarium pseudograminearum]